MNLIATASKPELNKLFRETSKNMPISAAFIEKDFWICWLLKQLYSIDEFAESIMFRGGTSLSKVYNAINRFSEDVDITIDKKLFGFTDTHESLQGTSRTKRRKLIIDMRSKCHAYISSDFMNLLHDQIASVLKDASTWSLVVRESNPEHIEFSIVQSTKRTWVHKH